jgi:hypothetical protein
MGEELPALLDQVADDIEPVAAFTPNGRAVKWHPSYQASEGYTTLYTAEQVRQAQRDAIAPYAERIRQLERELAAVAVDNNPIARASEILSAFPDDLLKRELADRKPSTSWRAIRTVGDMVNNLLTLDQATPIHAAFHIDYEGERRCRTRPVFISRERVIDDKWVDMSRTDVPYAAVVWAKQDERACIDGRCAGAAPEGWKLVPVEPTEAMLQAASAKWHGMGPKVMARHIRWLTADYKAMLAAAPTPTNSEKEEGE